MSRTINANFADPLRGGLSTLYLQSKISADAQVNGEGVPSTVSALWWSSWLKHLFKKSPFERKAALRADQLSLRCLTLVDLVCVCQKSNLMTRVNFFLYCKSSGRSYHVTLLLVLKFCLGGTSSYQLPGYLWFHSLICHQLLWEGLDTDHSSNIAPVPFWSLCLCKTYSHW